MDCVFCKIVAKEIAKDFFSENGSVVIFPDIRPAAPVHYLIVAKKHIQSVAHLERNHREIIAEMIYAARDAAKKIGLKGYKLVFNVGREGGQVIDHLHLHLLGGWKERGEIEAMPNPSLDK